MYEFFLKKSSHIDILILFGLCVFPFIALFSAIGVIELIGSRLPLYGAAIVCIPIILIILCRLFSSSPLFNCHTGYVRFYVGLFAKDEIRIPRRSLLSIEMAVKKFYGEREHALFLSFEPGALRDLRKILLTPYLNISSNEVVIYRRYIEGDVDFIIQQFEAASKS